jgi:peptidoglycan hydrolase CwlO-like protein
VLSGDLHELSATLANLASQKFEKEAAVKQLEASIAAETPDVAAIRRDAVDR